MAEDGTALVAGRSYRDAPEIDGLVWARGSAPTGSFVDVQIERVTPYDLWGRAVAVPQPVASFTP